MDCRWTIERIRGDAGTFHQRDLPAPPVRSLWLLEVDRPAVVLGSAQPADAVDQVLAAAQGIDVVRRRSGGAAVLLEPGRLVWADLVIGRDDPLWHDDVGRAAWWVGELWATALRQFGIAATVHRGPLQRGEYGDRVCFAGLGPGEVQVAGRKVVGVSQRRTRDAARFQTAALLQWEPGVLAALCGIGRLGDPVPPALADAAVGLGLAADEVAAAMVSALPA